MKIGEVIRKYRKEMDLTQEQMANYLGVTAPAVNKWENGNTYPDISLLAPIARLLGISTDLLLSYQEDLTDQEINQLISKLGDKIRQEDFKQVFSWAEEKIREYPNCDKMILFMAQVLDSYRDIAGAEDAGQYDSKIHEFYVRALNSKNRETAQAAAVSLFYFSLSKKQYELAQEYLDKIPGNTVDPRRLQAALYQRQGKPEESYQLYERLLLSGYHDINWALNGIYTLALEEQNLEKAEKIAEKQKKLAELLEMGKYMELSPGLVLAVYKKDKEASLQIMTDIVHNIKNMDDFKHSELYEHMKFSQSGKDNIIFMLLKGFEEDESLEFLKEDKRFKQLIKELKNMSESDKDLKPGGFKE